MQHSTATDTVTFSEIILLRDFRWFAVGGLNYGYVEYPVNIGEVMSKYANMRRKQNDNEQLKAEDIASPDDYKYKLVCFDLNNSEGNLALAGDGKHCPFTVQVLPPGDSLTQEGDIYGRFYEIEKEVHV